MNTHRIACSFLVIAATILAAASGGCNKDNLTGPALAATPTLAPAPTPIPANIEGSWTGTSRGRATGCNVGTASATFQQAGQKVTGTLNASGYCGFANLAFEGTLVSFQLSGNASGADGHATVTGTLLGTTLSVKIRGLDIDTAEVDLDLHR